MDEISFPTYFYKGGTMAAPRGADAISVGSPHQRGKNQCAQFRPVYYL